MRRQQLIALIEREVEAWSAKPFSQLAEELTDVRAYQRGENDGFHQFEIQLLENTSGYVHVALSIDDGSFFKSMFPITRSFIVHRDGRVET